MLQGYYSAASAMSAALQNQDILAQNLAHAPIPGYRRQMLSFEEFVTPDAQQTGSVSNGQAAAHASSSYGTQIARNSSLFAAGPYQHTGNPWECAIQGDGFFVLNGPNGPLYTRNGQFHVNADGELVNPSGYTVSGSNGPLRIPANAGQIIIAQDGTITADDAPVGQLRLAMFDDPSRLDRVGATLFAAPNGIEPQTSTALVRQGYREGSNVQIVQEMVQMIAGMRQYEAAAKAMHSLSDAMQQRTSAQM
jgi:flagellar basal-body rod protein FlgF